MKKKQSEGASLCQRSFTVLVLGADSIIPFSSRVKKGSQGNNILFPPTSSVAAPRKARLSLLTQNPYPHAPFGVIVSLVMGLHAVVSLKPGFSPWSGSYKNPACHTSGL